MEMYGDVWGSMDVRGSTVRAGPAGPAANRCNRSGSVRVRPRLIIPYFESKVNPTLFFRGGLWVSLVSY